MKWAAAAICLCGVAYAQPREEAARLSESGAEALKRRDHAAALVAFESAYRVYPSSKLLYNLGLALDGLGRNVEAATAFDRFLQESPDAPEAQRGYAQKRLGELDALCAHLRLTVTPPEAETSLDDHPLPVRGELRLLPGSHVVAAARPGFASARRSFEAEAGTTVEISLALLPIAAAPAPKRTPIIRRWWVWTLVAGAVTVGVVTAAAVVASQPAEPQSSLGSVTPRF